MLQIHVVVIDSHPLFCAGLSHTFNDEYDLAVVGQGHSADDAMRLLREASPDIIALDMDLGAGNTLIADILAQCPKAKILLIGDRVDTQLISAGLQTGAWGYLSKRSTSAELVRAVRCIHGGERYVTPALAAQLFTAVKPKETQDGNRFAKLTDREEQILDLLGIGLSNKEIGWRLTISEKTVKHYLTSILGKLNVQNRVQAALLVAGRHDTLTFA